MHLNLKTACQNGRTVLADCSFSAPLKVAKPFYHNNGYTEIMIMCASPGILAKDNFDMNFEMGKNTKTIISTQSYQKLFNTENEKATQNIQMQIEENASLVYCPHPIIPFAGAKFSSKTEINLKPSSKLIFADILACGRAGMGEKFAFCEYISQIKVCIDGVPVFLDCARLFPKKAKLSGIGFFEGYLCQGLLYLYGYENVSLPEFGELEVALSKAREGYVVRVLGNSMHDIYDYLKSVAQQQSVLKLREPFETFILVI